MKRLLPILLSLVLFATLVSPNSANAQATSQTWSSSITYYNTSSTDGEMVIVYYQGTNTYSSASVVIESNKAGSVAVGSVSGIPSSFKGSAVINSTVPVIATVVVFASANTSQYSRSFYTGFDPSKASSTFYLATVRSNGVTTSSFGIQNTESFEVTATLSFYKVGFVSPAFTYAVDIPQYSSYVAKINDVPGYIGNPFDGSLIITAHKKGEPATPGDIVASASETQDVGRGIIAYEGASEGAFEVFSASASCRRGPSVATTYFAVQNTSFTDTAQVTIEYYSNSGSLVGSVGPTAITPGNKLQTNPCTDNLLVGELGSARFTSVGAPIIVIGKYAGVDGLITAFTGETLGSTNLAAPYIRWAPNPSTNWSSFIAVMNVGSGDATNIVARYYDVTGTLRGEETLASPSNPLKRFIKVNTTPSSAGALINGGFGYSPANGGAVQIISDQPVVAVVRLTTSPIGIPGISTLGEDYNMLPLP